MQCAMLGGRHGNHVGCDGICCETVFGHTLDEAESGHDVECVRCGNGFSIGVLVVSNTWVSLQANLVPIFIC